jgi:hypothetical protein
MTPWETLGVARDVPVADLRRRYAALIKQFRPETHPQDFARIREAYEVALPFARRREAEAFETAAALEQAAPEQAAAPIAGEAVAEVAVEAPAEIAAASAPIAVLAEAMPAEVDTGEPGLATRFQRFHALAESVAGARDEAFLPGLRTLLQARASASLDDSQALEFALLRWFIESDQPPLTLLFETGRTFDWHLHPARLSGWLSPWALRQMEARLALSRDLVWARHFSGNAWLRRLHAPKRSFVPIASRPATQEAARWAERWRSTCDDADTPALAEGLDTRTLRRVHERPLLGTDVLAGLAFAGAANGFDVGVLYAVIGTVLTFSLRQALRWLLPEAGRSRLPGPLGAAVGKHPVWVLAAVAACLAALLARDEHGAELGWALLLLVPGLLAALLATWRAAAWLGRAAAELLSWRDAVDRLEFDGFVRQHAAATPGTPFGERLSTWQRWQAIPAALRLRKIEVATRARPMRSSVLRLKGVRLTWARPSIGRMVWIGLWVLFAIARAIHALGT